MLATTFFVATFGLRGDERVLLKLSFDLLACGSFVTFVARVDAFLFVLVDLADVSLVAVATTTTLSSDSDESDSASSPATAVLGSANQLERYSGRV